MDLTFGAVKVTVTVMLILSANDRPASRIEGLDLARALAILGMVIVNFEISMSASGQGPSWLGALTEALQGRAAGTFVVLAGIGASLGAARHQENRGPARLALVKRALFLFVLGTAFLPVWPADILHFYGAYLLIGAGLLFASTTALVLAACACAIIGVGFLLLGDWGASWNFTDFTYAGLWTPSGFTQNLLLDGFHPVFPWASLYLFGMLIGRAPLGESHWRRRAGLIAAALMIATAAAATLAPAGMDTPGPAALLATDCFPPGPAYLVAAAATSMFVISLCCELCQVLPQSLLTPFNATGRLALTIYVAHVVIGLGVLEALGRLDDQSLPFAVGSSLVFFSVAVVASSIWTRYFKRGPLEALMRRLAG